MRNYIRDIIIKGSGLFALCILLAAGMALPVSAAEGDVAVALGEDTLWDWLTKSGFERFFDKI